MAAGSALNLSLLSRGVGEVKRNGSEKVDVIFEPQDYFNFVEESNDRPFFLPPLQPRYGFNNEPSQISSTRYSSKDSVYLPKTFTTRKGALLLFSEDMAHKTKRSEAKKHKSIHGLNSERDLSLDTLNEDDSDQKLKTVDDLAKSILAYGSIDDVGKMNLKFMVQKQKRRNNFERQIRPGFSAKRYLSTWTKTWDDNTLEKVISKGYLTEKSLFYYNPLLPHLSRRLNDDLSHYPTPYKLMRSMLMSPGSLSGYTFYRVRPESQETDYYDIDEEDETQTLTKAGSVKVASITMDGQLKEAVYGELDHQAKTEVLTDLLVKGAVHYAMKTQQEYIDKMADIDEQSETKIVPQFDMREAVESMLIDSESKGGQKKLLEANLPERDDRSQHSGSFKGGKLGTHRGSRGQGDLSARDDASSASSGGAPGPLSGPAPLPPIGQTYTQLTPIGEASREHTQAYSLKVQENDDDDEGWAGRGMVEKHVDQRGHAIDEKTRLEKRKARVSAQSLDIEGPGGHQQHSGSESGGPGSTHSSQWLPPVHKQPQWKGSQQSLRSHGSRRPSGSLVDGDQGSTKGSIIFGPDGSAIKVGESVKLSARASQASAQDVHEVVHPGVIDAEDDSEAEVPDEWKDRQRPHSGQMSETLRKLPRRGEAYDPDQENEIWEGVKPEHFIGSKDGDRTRSHSAKSRSRVSLRGLSPERSKSELKYSPDASSHVFQRSYSSPLSDRSEGAKSRSRSESFNKNYRPLQSQLNIIEGETQVIREQTEISHFTAEKTEVSLMSEKGDADIADHKSELTLLDTEIKEEVEGQIAPTPAEGLAEKSDKSITEEQGDDQVEEGAEVSKQDLSGSAETSKDEEEVLAEKSEVESEQKSEEGSPKDLSLNKTDSGQGDEGQESPRTNVTEQEIIDKLTSHATHIAESVLSQSESGQVLEEDIRRAAAMWMDTHPPRDISRSQSVQDLPDTTVIQEVMKGHKRKSAGPTVAEYRDKIKGNLMTALAKATGLNQSEIPQDAEIDPELMEQLANNTLSPDDIEIVRDEESGRSFIRSRNRVINDAMGGVEKGHIYQTAAKNGDKRMSIPTDKKPADIGELDIINFQGQDGAKPLSDKGSDVGSKSIKSGAKSGSGQDEDLQKVLDGLSQGGSPAGPTSLQSGKSGDKSKVGSEKKAPSPEKKKEEFVVGKVKNKKELEDLYSQPVHAPSAQDTTEKTAKLDIEENKVVKKSGKSRPSVGNLKEKTEIKGKPKAKNGKPAVGKKKGEKGKKPKGKGKKKEEEEAPVATETVAPEEDKAPAPPKEKTPQPESPPLEREATPKSVKSGKSSKSAKSSLYSGTEFDETLSKPEESDDDEEYIIVRDETMSPEIEVTDKNLNITTSAEEEEPDEEQITAEDMEALSEADKLRMISNREARAAKRAAAAEKRRQEVERKRREREEQIKREKEESERQERLKQEQEELRKQKEEERRELRLKKQREEEENEEIMKEELEKQRREKAEAEREKRRKEEYARKLEEMKRKQLEEEKKRQEEAERRRLEEEEERKAEEEKMAKMAAEERAEYERMKREEEEERKRKEEEEKKRREEEAQKALEEARRLAEEMARKQAELEARLRFNRSLQMEANGLDHTQDITKAFVFSYFELLQWLGLDIPEFELLKLNQY